MSTKTELFDKIQESIAASRHVVFCVTNDSGNLIDAINHSGQANTELRKVGESLHGKNIVDSNDLYMILVMAKAFVEVHGADENYVSVLEKVSREFTSENQNFTFERN